MSTYICEHCEQGFDRYQSYSAHINNYCHVIKRNNRLREQQRQKEREEQIRLEEQTKLAEALKKAKEDQENEKTKLQLAFAKHLLHEKEQHQQTVNNQLTNIQNLLVSGHEKLDSHTEKLDEISQQQKQMLWVVENIIKESYIYFINQMKDYMDHCKHNNRPCQFIEFERYVLETNWEHSYILNCIKTKHSTVDIEAPNDEKKQLIMSIRPIWKPQIDQHLGTILTLIQDNFDVVPIIYDKLPPAPLN